MKAYLLYALILAALGYGMVACADKAGNGMQNRANAIEQQLTAIGA